MRWPEVGGGGEAPHDGRQQSEESCGSKRDLQRVDWIAGRILVAGRLIKLLSYSGHKIREI